MARVPDAPTRLRRPDGATAPERVPNIAEGQADAAAVTDAWMHSPGHRADILDCGFTGIGVGVSTDGGPLVDPGLRNPS
ncbi:CAP domain-containing protein [Streptomyces sp. NBC_00691]|uniref:CAP domain-containing protein n=1 Tax=Streptomyces sp. NBC_00691 TaxID=2903671 RepID=UPI002E37ECB3|nr:CAP domain-containing protein [Streptomyces sp. NBC_00691]